MVTRITGRLLECFYAVARVPRAVTRVPGVVAMGLLGYSGGY